jgi:hypothetical protein
MRSDKQLRENLRVGQCVAGEWMHFSIQATTCSGGLLAVSDCAPLIRNDISRP